MAKPGNKNRVTKQTKKMNTPAAVPAKVDKAPKKSEANKAPKKKKEGESNCLPTRILNKVKENTANSYISDLLNTHKEEHKGEPHPMTSEYRKNQIRFSKNCDKRIESVVSKAIVSFLNIAAEDARANKKKTINVDNLLNNHNMLKSPYAPLFVSLPELNPQKVDMPDLDKDGNEQVNDKGEVKMHKDYDLADLDPKYHIFVNKLKKNIKDFGNDPKTGKPIKISINKKFHVFMSNLIVAFCKDFAKKVELFLSGTNLKTANCSVVKVLLQLLLTPGNVSETEYVETEGTREVVNPETKEKKNVNTVNVEPVYKLEDGSNLETLL